MGVIFSHGISLSVGRGEVRLVSVQPLNSAAAFYRSVAVDGHLGHVLVVSARLAGPPATDRPTDNNLEPYSTVVYNC